jgi:hypothetical protein
LPIHRSLSHHRLSHHHYRTFFHGEEERPTAGDGDDATTRLLA